MDTNVTTVTNAQVKTAKVTQTANAELGMAEKNLCYLIIITDKGNVRINVGEKTYTTVTDLLPKPEPKKGGK